MWIARDKDGTLKQYLDFPKRHNTYKYWDWTGDDDFLILNENLFPELTWEDEPIEVEIVVKKNYDIDLSSFEKSPEVDKIKTVFPMGF